MTNRWCGCRTAIRPMTPSAPCAKTRPRAPTWVCPKQASSSAISTRATSLRRIPSRLDAHPEAGGWQRAVAAGKPGRLSRQSAPGSGRRAGVAAERLIFAPALPLDAASGAAEAGRPVPGYPALQRPHHRQRRVVGGGAAADLRGYRLSRPCRRQPAWRRRPARTGDRSAEEFEALAIKLANDPKALKKVRDKLAKNKTKTALFDTDRFRKNIEAAYTKMWERWLAGEKPSGFAVKAQD